MAVGGGVAGALAMVLQVLTLMPLRTIMNYRTFLIGSQVSLDRLAQNFPSFARRVSKRWLDQGIVQPPQGFWRIHEVYIPFLASLPSTPTILTSPFSSFVRFYAGLPAALFQGPLSRFGDTAANAGIIALLETVELPYVFLPS
jgi:hypothetical protein